MEKVKLGDVAKKAGVSLTTVSRVLNNRGYISKETRKKVNDAMEELNYFPNEIARSLFGNKTNFVGLLFPNVTNPFYGEIVSELESTLASRGYKSLICNTYNNEEKESNYLKMVLANQVDGIIVGSRNRPSSIYQSANLPIVAIDRFVSSKVPIVRSDNYGGACLATEYLIEKECKNIVHFTGSSEEEIKKCDLRMQGYIDTMLKYGKTPRVMKASFDEDEVYQRCKVADYLSASPEIDGAFAAGDTLAGIIYACCKQKGIDMEIVGYDGASMFTGLCGGVSTIRQPIKKMARLATDILLDAIAGTYQEYDSEHVLPVELIKRSY
ncbi:MAG: LacI family transcriptional regulator [Defluviitaleaceae bacterium]|nr:LacI family transcriptional regulator [Defluviitaleaceae bacterium]